MAGSRSREYNRAREHNGYQRESSRLRERRWDLEESYVRQREIIRELQHHREAIRELQHEREAIREFQQREIIRELRHHREAIREFERREEDRERHRRALDSSGRYDTRPFRPRATSRDRRSTDHLRRDDRRSQSPDRRHDTRGNRGRSPLPRDRSPSESTATHLGHHQVAPQPRAMVSASSGGTPLVNNAMVGMTAPGQASAQIDEAARQHDGDMGRQDASIVSIFNVAQSTRIDDARSGNAARNRWKRQQANHRLLDNAPPCADSTPAGANSELPDTPRGVISPKDVVPITGAVPDPETFSTEAKKAAGRRKLDDNHEENLDVMIKKERYGDRGDLYDVWSGVVARPPTHRRGKGKRATWAPAAV